jgi:hypothetical protein
VERPFPGDDLTVQLRPGYPVRLTLGEGLPFPEPPLTLTADFEPVVRPRGFGPDHDYGLTGSVVPAGYHAMNPEFRLDPDLHFDPADETLDVLVPFPGEWRVCLSVMRSEVEESRGSYGRFGIGTGLGDEDSPIIEVRDAEGMQEFALAPDAERYLGILEAERSRR